MPPATKAQTEGGGATAPNAGGGANSSRRFWILTCVVVGVMAMLLSNSAPEISQHKKLALPLHRKMWNALQKETKRVVFTTSCDSAAVGYHAVMDTIVNGTLFLTSVDATVHGQLGLGDGRIDSHNELSMAFSTFFESSASTEHSASVEYLSNLTRLVRELPGVRVAAGGYGGVAAQQLAKSCKKVFLAASPGDELQSYLPATVTFPDDVEKTNENNVVLDSYLGEKWGWINFQHAASGTLRIRPHDSRPLDAVPSWATTVEKNPPRLLYLSGLQLLGATSASRDERNTFLELTCDLIEKMPKQSVAHMTLSSCGDEKSFIDIVETVGESVDSVALSFKMLMDWVNVQQTHQIQPSADRKPRMVDFASAGIRTLHHHMNLMKEPRTRNITRLHIVTDAFQMVCHETGTGSKFVNVRSSAIAAAHTATQLSCGDETENTRVPMEEARKPISGENLPHRVPEFYYGEPVTCYDDGPLHCCVAAQLSCPSRPMVQAEMEEKIAVVGLMAAMR